MRKRLKLIVPLAVVLIAGLYFTVLSKPETVAKPRIDGEVYVLPKEFLVNLKEGRYAKVTVALVLHHGALDSGGGHGAAPPEPPEGFGPLPQEAVVRDLVTEELTGASADDLISAAGRKRVKRHLLHAIEKHTDVHAERVLLTDVAVQ